MSDDSVKNEFDNLVKDFSQEGRTFPRLRAFNTLYWQIYHDKDRRPLYSLLKCLTAEERIKTIIQIPEAGQFIRNPTPDETAAMLSVGKDPSWYNDVHHPKSRSMIIHKWPKHLWNLIPLPTEHEIFIATMLHPSVIHPGQYKGSFKNKHLETKYLGLALYLDPNLDKHQIGSDWAKARLWKDYWAHILHPGDKHE